MSLAHTCYRILIEYALGSTTTSVGHDVEIHLEVKVLMLFNGRLANTAGLGHVQVRRRPVCVIEAGTGARVNPCGAL